MTIEFRRKPLIYLITKGDLTVENFNEEISHNLRIIEKAVETEISLIQIREKKLPAKLIFELAEKAVKISKHSKTKLLINDRADIALAADADGVHLTAGSIPAKIVRSTFPKDFIISVSTHSFEKAESAKNQGADFVTFSPIYDSPNKGKPLGTDLLREVCEKLNPFPIIALGGIDETNYLEVLKFADGFAAIRFLNNEINLQRLSNE